MASLFSLPTEILLSALFPQFPGREPQIRSLATVLSIHGAPSRNIVLHGLEGTGKSAVVKAVLEELSHPSNINGKTKPAPRRLRYAIVRSTECISGRHLLEQTVGSVAKELQWKGNVGRCENLSQLVVELSRLLESWTESEEAHRRLVLVFDGIDRQKDAPPTLLPALARLGEIIPNLTSIFIVTSPRPNFLHYPGTAYVDFPTYTKPELLQILALTKPNPQLPSGAKETIETWTRFIAAVYDSLSKHSGRDVVSFRNACTRLWPRFVQPILDGSLNPTPFSKLLVANRSLFQNESVLIHNIISDTADLTITPQNTQKKYQGIAAHLPYYSRLLLVAAYLSSFNPPRTDVLFFMKAAASKRRKKGGGTAKSRPGVSKNRKISRKLLGPQAFVLERMLAIFHAIKEDANGRQKGNVTGSADIQMAVATLASLRLLMKVGSASDPLDGGVKYRVAIGWEVVRSVARSVGIEVEDYLAE